MNQTSSDVEERRENTAGEKCLVANKLYMSHSSVYRGKQTAVNISDVFVIPSQVQHMLVPKELRHLIVRGSSGKWMKSPKEFEISRPHLYPKQFQ